MSKNESESKQEACGLDLPDGLHQEAMWLKYPQKFIRAPKSCYPDHPKK